MTFSPSLSLSSVPQLSLSPPKILRGVFKTRTSQLEKALKAGGCNIAVVVNAEKVRSSPFLGSLNGGVCMCNCGLWACVHIGVYAVIHDFIWIFCEDIHIAQIAQVPESVHNLVFYSVIIINISFYVVIPAFSFIHSLGKAASLLSWSRKKAQQRRTGKGRKVNAPSDCFLFFALLVLGVIIVNTLPVRGKI